jgi:16S rRNA (uracil1498-N3)-methyltransferase
MHSAYLASVEQITAQTVVARVIDTLTDASPRACLTIVQGIPKPPKADLIVQKLTELGADNVVFAPTEFTSYPDAFEKMSARLDRLRKITKAAAKQCARRDIPRVITCASLEEAVETVPAGSLLLVANEKSPRANLRDLLARASEKCSIAAFIGPEGGFSDEEIRLLEGKDAACFSLGRNILRTETAALIAAAIILYELGEI